MLEVAEVPVPPRLALSRLEAQVDMARAGLLQNNSDSGQGEKPTGDQPSVIESPVNSTIVQTIAEAGGPSRPGVPKAVGQESQNQVPVSPEDPLPKVARKVLESQRFREISDEIRQKGEGLTEQEIEEKAVEQYYGEWAKDISQNEVSKEIAEDPLYRESWDRVLDELKESRQIPDGKALQEKALANYKKAKDLQEQSQVQQEGEKTAEQKLKEMEKTIKEMRSEMQEMKKLLGELVKHAAETDPEKKKNLLIEILKYAAIVLGNAFMETGKQIEPSLKS
ncbi:MAG: hypothetical protein A2W22_05680 [Candidatus Levybacteria bacterium RBG_16_35_11]|nr:MAG: hypothetical protein A2W22_05680 [Candidatus Levybacteria bacterium RBG_16_35_11]